ncbi:MAG: hypothetical protein P9L97_10735 [Candidatus Tenebribacter davisii]|nr:hypothetical protein [Candidatus Tenebribacter davisii]
MEKEYIDYISRKELAELTGRNQKTIYRAFDGKLKTIKEGKINRIPKAFAWEWWNKYYAPNSDPLKNLEIKRSLGIIEDSEEDVATENISAQNEGSSALIKIDDTDYEQWEKTEKPDNTFLIQLRKFGFDCDENGIFIYNQNDRLHLTNFNEVEYICNIEIDQERVRVIKLNETEIEFKPQDLLNSNSFNRRLLSNSNHVLEMEKGQFSRFKNLILSLDNDKYVTSIPGFGMISENIFNLGNKIMLNRELRDHEETVWIDNNGFKIDKTDLVFISEKEIDLIKIWEYFFQLYGMQAVLIIGYAIATMFFQQYMKLEKHFPLLYVLAGSGRGKNGLTDLICSLFGLNESLVNVNCAGNSTKIGVESKSLLLHNLPLLLNELTVDHFDFIKSRYDGQGSVKYNEKSSNQISERSVNGSTVITTVVEPLDKQIISRCIFVDLDSTELQKEFFDKVREESVDFSGFMLRIIKGISFQEIMNSVCEFRKEIYTHTALPRIIDNYCLIGGCFNIFRKLVKDGPALPKPEQVASFIDAQIKSTEDYLNPLIYFIRELERLSGLPPAAQYYSQNSDYLFFNFNSIWRLIKDSYKKRYFPFMQDKNIKRLLLESDYMAVYGSELKPADKNMLGKPVHSYNKKIGSVSRRCYVLRKDRLPGYYR